MSTITLAVTADDIAIDRFSSGGCCAIARAAKRVIPDRFAWVTRNNLRLDAKTGETLEDGYPIGVTTNVPFPEHVLDWHRAFMGSQPVEPITFSLDIPDVPDTGTVSCGDPAP